jgi:hypothetical protein
MPSVVQIDDIEEGMVLAEPIVNSFGQTLINSGIELKDNHIRVLKTWSIRSVTIKEDENEEEVEITKEMIILAQKKVAERVFWKPRTDEEKDMYKSVVLHFAKNISTNDEEE